MQKIYFFVLLAISFGTFSPHQLQAQDCSLLTASITPYESRCAATGSIKVLASGGSGNYVYRVVGPVTSSVTTSDSLTGLSAGVYSVIVNDLTTNCTYTATNIIVPGTYRDPRFSLNKVDVSCDNGANGSISVSGQLFGRSPFTYSIMAPSAFGVGTTNSTGVFDNLPAGNYTIRLTDSCGGIQTRMISINNYTWWIDAYAFQQISCDSASGWIRVIDSRGNISTVNGIPGLTYGIVRAPGDTVWSANPTFTFALQGHQQFEIVVKDACNKIKRGNTSVSFHPSVAANVQITNQTCSTFTATATGLVNIFEPEFCLYDSANNLIDCNETGSFGRLEYGRYCISVHDMCTDTTITRCFTATPPPISVASNVLITDKTCKTFTATITGQVGLTNPSYCLFDSLGNRLECNSTGVFEGLLYGRYCIEVQDGCRDTAITRCFNVLKPVPTVPDTIIPSYVNCNNFGLDVNGDSLISPTFCLYDSLSNLIGCNDTGIFDSIPFGQYCVHVTDPCYDTTFIRCLSVGEPVYTNDVSVAISNKACSTFTVTANSGTITNGQYCLYSATDSLIACNATGVFTGLPYGDYCVHLTSPCPDTTFIRCFSATPNLPSVAATVKVTPVTCNTFTAEITGQTNLTNPQYCLYNQFDSLIRCNTNGIFSNLLYGHYCIRITNTCVDTVIERCFDAEPTPVSISATASKSCSYGYARFRITVRDAIFPVNIRIYDTAGALIISRNFTSSPINIDSIAGINSNDRYTIIATDLCNAMDTVTLGATASYFTHVPVVTKRCPSGTWANGSGDVRITTSTNMGAVTVRLIKKNGVWLSPQLAPNTASGGVYTYTDLEAGTYIFIYRANDGCNKYLYDTVTIAPYVYPNLDRSSAYQCDVNGFSVGAVVSDGVGPFTYEIIGSTPALPSIIAAPQTSPIFSINNGTTYSLIRLRALDACGNATLGDASIFPLANTGIEATFNCFQLPTTLSVDTIYNSTYSWYKKEHSYSTDSTYIGSGYSYFVPEVAPADTGIYICHIQVNNGCIERTYYFHLDGGCYHLLPLNLTDFSGRRRNFKVQLAWEAQQEQSTTSYEVQRKISAGTFESFATVSSRRAANSRYEVWDDQPLPGTGFYRLKIRNENGSVDYSKVVAVGSATSEAQVEVYPNPAHSQFQIVVNGQHNHVYSIRMLNNLGQPVYSNFLNGNTGNNLTVVRNNNMANGMYIIQILDMDTQTLISRKILLR